MAADLSRLAPFLTLSRLTVTLTETLSVFAFSTPTLIHEKIVIKTFLIETTDIKIEL
jgi:hypothetical protein